MLEIVKYNEDEYEFPCLLVLGCFDGLHIGHAELLKKAKLQAKINGLDLGVMMFADGKGGKQVCSFEDRVALLEQYNVKFVLKIEFTNDFKNTKPLDFLQILEDKLNVKAYMSGKDFRFGAGAKGKSSTLKNYCEDEENGVWYMSVKDVLSGSDKVSTTVIKNLLENGDISRAGELLGRNFSVTGTVTETCGSVIKANYPQNIVKLKDGAYTVKCTVGENEYNGKATVGGVIEINLEDFGGNIDGQQVKIEFLACGDLSSEETAIRPETEHIAPAVEELAVAEDNGEITETAEPVENAESEDPSEAAENAEPADNVEVEQIAAEPTEAEQELPAENLAEDSEFEEELDEEFEEPAVQSVEEPIEETVEEASEEPVEESDGSTLTEVAEEPAQNNETDESYTLTEIAEEPAEEIVEEETPIEEPAEEISAEELSAEINEEENTAETTEEVSSAQEELPAEEEIIENTENAEDCANDDGENEPISDDGVCDQCADSDESDETLLTDETDGEEN